MTSGTRAGDPATVADEAACCALRKQRSCTNWIYGHPGDEEYLLADGVDRADDDVADADARRQGWRHRRRLSTSAGALLYGSGSGKDDAAQLTAKSATPYVDNTACTRRTR